MSKSRTVVRNLLLFTGLASVTFAQTTTFTSGSVANYGPIVAPDSIAAGFGTNLVTATTPAPSLPLGTTLGNASVSITDSKGMKFNAPLFLVAPGQINYLIPATVALGKATVSVTSGSNTFTGTLEIANIAPGIITADSSGKGVPAAQVVRLNAAGMQTVAPAFTAGTAANSFTTSPISLATASDQVYLMLYATGIRRHSLNPVIATIGGVRVPVTYAGAQSQFPGLDQINIGPLPQSLVGKGQVDLMIMVDGVPVNTVQIAFQ